MKRNYYLSLIMLVLSVSVHAQTQWIDTKLDEKILVKFPSISEKKTGNGTVSYVCKTKDSITFTATILDYQIIAKIDSSGLAAIKDTKAFADQLRAGILTQRKNYVLGEVEIGKWKTFTTYQIRGKRNSDNSILYLKMTLIGSKLYGLSCLVPDQLITKDNEIFLNSFEFIKP